MQKQNDTMTAINAEEPRSHNNPSIKIDTGLKWGNGEMRLAVDSSQSSYSVPSGIHQKRYTRTTQLPPIHQNWYIPEPQKIQQGNVWISKETILRFNMKDATKPSQTLPNPSQTHQNHPKTTPRGVSGGFGAGFGVGFRGVFLFRGPSLLRRPVWI